MTIQDTIPKPNSIFHMDFKECIVRYRAVNVFIHNKFDGQFTMEAYAPNTTAQYGDLYYFRIKLKPKK